jgi:hypothetical protein
MACVYVLRHGSEDLFKVGRTKGTIAKTIDQLSRGNPYRLTEFARIETEEEIACETHLHHALRSKRVVDGGGTEFFRIDPGELREAIRNAEEYVTEFLSVKRQAEKLSLVEDLAVESVKPTPVEMELYSQLLKVREDQDRLKAQRNYFESKLKLSMGVSSALEGIATWKGEWKHTLDVPTFRAAEPGLYEELYRRFGSESYRRKFLLQRLSKNR